MRMNGRVRSCDSFRATLVIDVLSSGGAQRQLCMLAEGLKRRGHDVAVLVYWSGDFFARQLEDAGVPIVRVSARNRPHLVYRVRRAIGETRPEVVVAFLPGPSLLMELAGLPKRGFALIVSERNLDPPRIGMGRRLRLNLHRLADAVVANSHAQHDRIRKAAPYLAGRTSAITNGVDLQFFAPAESPRRMEPGRLRLLVLARPVSAEEPLRAAGSSRDRPARAPGHRLEHRLVRQTRASRWPETASDGRGEGGRTIRHTSTDSWRR